MSIKGLELKGGKIVIQEKEKDLRIRKNYSLPQQTITDIEELAKKHPNWKFTALYTNLDWNYVIDNENVFGTNLVPKNYNDRWKNTKPRRI